MHSKRPKLKKTWKSVPAKISNDVWRSYRTDNVYHVMFPILLLIVLLLHAQQQADQGMVHTKFHSFL